MVADIHAHKTFIRGKLDQSQHRNTKIMTIDLSVVHTRDQFVGNLYI